MAKIRLLKQGHGDLCLAEWEPNIPDTIPLARSIFDEQRIGKLAFRLDGPGLSTPIEAFDENAPEILLVPPIMGGAPTRKTIYSNREEKPGYKPIELKVVEAQKHESGTTSSPGYSFTRTVYGPRGGIFSREQIVLSRSEISTIVQAIEEDLKQNPVVAAAGFFPTPY